MLFPSDQLTHEADTYDADNYLDWCFELVDLEDKTL